jgi:predicted esterase
MSRRANLMIGAVIASAMTVAVCLNSTQKGAALSTLARLYERETPEPVSLSADGRFALAKHEVDGGFEMQVFEAATRRLVGKYRGKNQQLATWNPVQPILAFVENVPDLGDYSFRVRVWDPLKNVLLPLELPLTFASDRYMRWSPDGTRLAYFVLRSKHQSPDNRVEVVDLNAKPTSFPVFQVDKTTDFAWSHDGNRLAIVDGVAGDVAVVNVAGMTVASPMPAVTRIVADIAVKHVSWPHVGTSLLVSGRATTDDKVGLFLLDQRSNVAQRLPSPLGDVTYPRFLADDQHFVYQAEHEGQTRLVHGDRNGTVAYLSPPGECGPFNVNAQGDAVTAWFTRGDRPKGLFEFRPDRDPVPVFFSPSAEELRFPVPRYIRIPSPEGGIPAILWRPPGKLRGVYIEVHGGGRPGLQMRVTTTAANAHILAQEGVAVLYVNFRGSSGYGQSFLESDREEFAVDDVRSAVAYAKTTLGVAPRQIVLFGISTGSAVALQVAATEETPIGGLVLMSVLAPRASTISPRRSLPRVIRVFHGGRDDKATSSQARATVEKILGRQAFADPAAFNLLPEETHIPRRQASWVHFTQAILSAFP